MKTLDEYRAELMPLLTETAFLRVDRGDALLITDAPLRADRTPLLPDDYETVSDGRLMRITPKLTLLPEEARPCYIAYLKTKDEKPLRQCLALCLRYHYAEAAARLERMLYET